MKKEKLVLFLQRMALVTPGQATAIAEEFNYLALEKNEFLLQAG